MFTVQIYTSKLHVLTVSYFISDDQCPIVAIILTHFHADHTFGLETFTKVKPKNKLIFPCFTFKMAFLLKAYPEAKVYAHDTLEEKFQQLLNVRQKITFRRAAFQFGTHLDNNDHENSGIGYRLKQ